MKDRYIVFDTTGIIHSSTNFDDAEDEFNTTDDFEGNLMLVKLLNVRR